MGASTRRVGISTSPIHQDSRRSTCTEREMVPAGALTGLPRIATIRARDGAHSAALFHRRGAAAVKEVILTPEGYERLKHEIEELATLEERLRDARVISKKDIAKDVVSVGSKVKLRDVAAKETIEYQIVGSAEANPAANKLSKDRKST